MKEPKVSTHLEAGWVTVDYLKSKVKFSIAQTRDLDIRLGREKHLIEKKKFTYLNKKNATLKSRGNKYIESHRDIYRLNSDGQTFRRLFLLYYDKNRHWDFILSQYARQNGYHPLRQKWQVAFRWLTMHTSIREVETLEYISPVFLHLLYTNERKLNRDWRTHFESFRDKCFTEQAADQLAFMKLLEAFWTYELFSLPEDEGKKNLRNRCLKTLSLVRKAATEIERQSISDDEWEKKNKAEASR